MIHRGGMSDIVTNDHVALVTKATPVTPAMSDAEPVIEKFIAVGKLTDKPLTTVTAAPAPIRSTLLGEHASTRAQQLLEQMYHASTYVEEAAASAQISLLVHHQHYYPFTSEFKADALPTLPLTSAVAVNCPMCRGGQLGCALCSLVAHALTVSQSVSMNDLSPETIDATQRMYYDLYQKKQEKRAARKLRDYEHQRMRGAMDPETQRQRDAEWEREKAKDVEDDRLEMQAQGIPIRGEFVRGDSPPVEDNILALTRMANLVTRNKLNELPGDVKESEKENESGSSIKRKRSDDEKAPAKEQGPVKKKNRSNSGTAAVATSAKKRPRPVNEAGKQKKVDGLDQVTYSPTCVSDNEYRSMQDPPDGVMNRLVNAITPACSASSIAKTALQVGIQTDKLNQHTYNHRIMCSRVIYLHSEAWRKENPEASEKDWANVAAPIWNMKVTLLNMNKAIGRLAHLYPRLRYLCGKTHPWKILKEQYGLFVRKMEQFKKEDPVAFTKLWETPYQPDSATDAPAAAATATAACS